MSKFHTRDHETELEHRHVPLELNKLNVEERTIEAILSTEHVAKRFFGDELLTHSAEAVDLGRAANGLPLLFTHRQDQPIGRVRNVRLEGERLVGTLHFSRSELGESIFAQVQERTLTDISIGYRVYEWDESTRGKRVATNWEVFEASVVAVPEDPNARMKFRAHTEDDDMTDPTPAAAPVENRAAAEIAEIFKPFATTHGELFMRAIAEEMTPDAARNALLAELAANPVQVPSTAGSPATAGEDAFDKFRQAADEWAAVKFNQLPELNHRAAGETWTKPLDFEQGLVNDELKARYTGALQSRGANPYIGMPVIELARRFLVDVRGRHDVASMTRAKVYDELHRDIAAPHVGDDFSNLLVDAANKSLQTGYVEAPESWQAFCKTGTLPDFKTAHRPVMSTFGDLDTITGDREYEHGTFSDRKETIALLTKGKLFGISRQALIDDDLSAFASVPRHMGRAANRAVGDSVYSILTTNAAMADGIALFHASHSNLAGSGAAVSVTTLNAALTSYATQTDPAGNVIAVRPAHILHPWAIWGTVKTLIASQHTGTNTEENIWQGELNRVPEARLDADSTTAWYPGRRGRVHRHDRGSFPRWHSNPISRQREGWNRDGVEYKVRFDYGTAVLDWRGLYKNAGA